MGLMRKVKQSYNKAFLLSLFLRKKIPFFLRLLHSKGHKNVLMFFKWSSISKQNMIQNLTYILKWQKPLKNTPRSHHLVFKRFQTGRTFNLEPKKEFISSLYPKNGIRVLFKDWKLFLTNNLIIILILAYSIFPVLNVLIENCGRFFCCCCCCPYKTSSV